MSILHNKYFRKNPFADNSDDCDMRLGTIAASVPEVCKTAGEILYNDRSIFKNKILGILRKKI